MLCVARVVLPGLPHHLTHRGNNRQDVFFVPDDRRAYRHILRKQTERHGVTIQGYCLITNHVHLIATPRSPAADSAPTPWTGRSEPKRRSPRQEQRAKKKRES
jgi:REP element-mobilizing transposase RayT